METFIDFKVGGKQGDNMAPVLFLFLMMAFAETLEDKWTALGLNKSQFAFRDNSPRSTGQLVIHQPGTITSDALFDIFYRICVENGTIIFKSRIDMKIGLTLISNHFTRFVLEIHIGKENNP